MPAAKPEFQVDPNYVDPVVEALRRNVDKTLIEKNLRLTHEERLLQLMELQRFAEELKRAGRAAKERDRK